MWNLWTRLMSTILVICSASTFGWGINQIINFEHTSWIVWLYLYVILAGVLLLTSGIMLCISLVDKWNHFKGYSAFLVIITIVGALSLFASIAAGCDAKEVGLTWLFLVVQGVASGLTWLSKLDQRY